MAGWLPVWLCGREHALWNWGRYLGMGEFDEAKADLVTAAKLDPKNPDIRATYSGRPSQRTRTAHGRNGGYMLGSEQMALLGPGSGKLQQRNPCTRQMTLGVDTHTPLDCY